MPVILPLVAPTSDTGADLLRIVTIGVDGRARVVQQLETAGLVYKERDTFTVAPGGRQSRLAVSGSRYGGSRVIGEQLENGTITATFSVKGISGPQAAERVEALLANVDRAQVDLFIEWRPVGLARSAYSEIRGPATWAPTYRAVEWPQTNRTSVQVTWPVAPLPQGLPLDVYDRFDRDDGEEPLGEYYVADRGSGIETVTPGSVRQNNVIGSAGLTVHVAREPTPDHEALVGGRIDQLAGDGTLTHFLTPGVRWTADDGQFMFATITGTPAASVLALYWFNGAVAVLMGTTGIGTTTVGTRYWLACRGEGDQVIAEFYGTNVPAAARDNYVASVRVLLDAAGDLNPGPAMGAIRVGHPVLRARGASAGAITTVERFNAAHYIYPGRRLPEAVLLPAVPGTAPALLGIGAAAVGAASYAYALLGWRERRGVHNRALYGANDSLTQHRWYTTGALLASGATLSSAAGPGVNYPNATKITTDATANTGARYEVNGRFRQGRRYTVEFRADQTGANGWEVRARADTTDTVASLIGATLAWSDGVSYLTFVLAADYDRLDISFRHTAATAGNTLTVAGLRVYEGAAADAPGDNQALVLATQTYGHGAHPPFGVIPAIDRTPDSTVGWTETGTLFDRSIRFAMTGAVTAHATYRIDPAMLLEPDFGTDIDLDVYVVGLIPSTLVSPRMWAWLAFDRQPQAALSYAQPFGSDGKALQLPSSGTRRRMWRLGTLPVRREARDLEPLRLTVEVSTAAGSTGNLTLAYLLLAPAAGSSSSPTGKVYDSSYPQFWYETDLTKVIRSDGSAALVDVDGVGSGGVGLGGDCIEVAPGDVEVLAQMITDPPDQPVVNTSDMSEAQALIRGSVTPRYRLMAPSA